MGDHVCECVCECICECVYRISFTNFGFFKYEPRYEFGHLKLRRCLGLRADGWLNERTSGQRGERRGGGFEEGGRKVGRGYRLLFCCCIDVWPAAVAAAHNCCHCQRVLLLLGEDEGRCPQHREATTKTTTSWRQPQLCLGQRRTANDPFNGPLHKMPYQPALPCPALLSRAALDRLGLPWLLVNNWTLFVQLRTWEIHCSCSFGID